MFRYVAQFQPDRLHTSPVSMILLNFIHYLRLPLLNMYFYRSLWVCDNFSKGPLPNNASKGIFTANIIQKRSNIHQVDNIVTQFTVAQKCNWENIIKPSQMNVYPYFPINYENPSKYKRLSLDSFSWLFFPASQP